MKLHRNTVWLLPLVAILTFPLWRIPVGSFLTPRGGFEQPAKTPKNNTRSFNMETVKILQSQQGEKTALIRAQSARTDKDPNIFILETVEADIFDENGKTTHIVSKTGMYNINTKLLTLIDDVVVNKTDDKQILYTDLLHYDNNNRTVNCPGKTRLVSEDATITGGSLSYDIESAQYDIGGRVSVILDGFSAPDDAPEPQTTLP